jgi:hypothetical protein
MFVHLLGAALAVCAQPAKPAVAAPTMVALADKDNPCILNVPAAWQAKSMTWSGQCKDKLAEGNGVARMLSGNRVMATWYGDAKNGAPSFGVLESGGSFQMGKFANGDFLPSEAYFKSGQNPADGDPGRAASVEALAKGSKAANALSAQYLKAGNKASAVFYRKKAQKLETVLD